MLEYCHNFKNKLFPNALTDKKVRFSYQELRNKKNTKIYQINKGSVHHAQNDTFFI
jgi:hypothetical protein